MTQVSEQPTRCIEPHAIATLPAISRFVVADVIKVGNTIGNYRVALVSPDFTEHFGDLVEENIPAGKLRSWNPVYYPFDTLIIEALGGNEKAQTHIARMAQVIEQDEEGLGLFENEGQNVHFKRSPKDNKMWALCWGLIDGELYFLAYPTPHALFIGDRAYSNE